MSALFTDQIETNSFIGLVSNKQPSTNIKKRAKRFVKVEGSEVMMNFAIATVVIIMGLAMGSLSQQKMELAKYSPAPEASELV